MKIPRAVRRPALPDSFPVPCALLFTVIFFFLLRKYFSIKIVFINHNDGATVGDFEV